MSSQPEIVDISLGKSLFDFKSRYWKSNFGNDRSIHRLCDLMRKMDVKRVIIEKYQEHFLDNDIKNELDNLEDVLEKNLKYEIARFTFIRADISFMDEIDKIQNNDFLASVILINLELSERLKHIYAPEEEEQKKWNGWVSYIFKGIVKRPCIKEKTVLNNYIHILRDHKCEVSLNEVKTKRFEIRGTYFCQQNRITSVCAHACLCMIVNNMDSQPYITTHYINEVLGRKDWFNVGGLYIVDIEKVIKNLGLKTYYKNYFQDPTVSFEEYLYPFLESRFPSIICFTTRDVYAGHVVDVIGHTLNTDLWKGEARVFYSKDYSGINHYRSSEWVDHFIINDDNLGMYLCLPVDLLKRITLPQYDPLFRIYYSLSVIPIDIELSPRQAEYYSVLVLNKLLDNLECFKEWTDILNIWVKRLLEQRRLNPFVTRTLLVTKNEYKHHLETTQDYLSNKHKTEEIDKLIENVPNHFWLTEVSIEDLYTTNKSKIIDIVYICDKKMEDITGETEIEQIKKILENCKLIKMPELSFMDVSFLLGQEGSQKPIIHANSIRSHMGLFKFEKSDDIMEW